MEEKHAWVPWFRELAGKIAAGGEEYLIKQAKQVDWRKNTPALLKYGDEKLIRFRFFIFLHSLILKISVNPYIEALPKYLVLAIKKVVVFLLIKT